MFIILAKNIKPSKKKTKPSSSKIKTRRKKKSIYPLKDTSKADLIKLFEEGYDKVRFRTWDNPDPCPKCRRMNGRTWNLINFINTTEHDAPLFSHSHVNCRCYIIVYDTEGILPTAYVDYRGEFFREEPRTFKDELEKIINEDY